MTTSTTPNMDLVLPGVLTEPGPDWAAELNTALERIDQHDHTSGNGVLIPTAALNINTDLSFNGFALTDLADIVFEDLGGDPSGNTAVYSKSGDLYFKNATGNVVQITNGPSLAGFPGSITNLGAGGSSAIYNNINKDISFYFTAMDPAALNIGDIRLFPFDGLNPYTNSITLKSPTSLGASYSITMPGSVPTNSNVVSMNGAGVLSTGLAPGSAANPSAAFAADLGTGLYSPGAGNLGLATAGALRFQISGDQLLGNALGTAAAPLYSFLNDTDTGIFSPSANNLSFTTAGTSRLRISGDQLLGEARGTAGAPLYSFNLDSDTGIYSPSANNLAFATAGAERFLMSGVQLLSLDLGSASGPTYSFNADTNTGLYSPSSDTLGMAVGGTNMLNISSAGVSIDGGGSFKVSIFTGTIAPSGLATLPGPGSLILGASGASTLAASGYIVMPSVPTATSTNSIIFRSDSSGGTNSIHLANTDASNVNTYRVVMFYQ